MNDPDDDTIREHVQDIFVDLFDDNPYDDLLDDYEDIDEVPDEDYGYGEIDEVDR